MFGDSRSGPLLEVMAGLFRAMPCPNTKLGTARLRLDFDNTVYKRHSGASFMRVGFRRLQGGVSCVASCCFSR